MSFVEPPLYILEDGMANDIDPEHSRDFAVEAMQHASSSADRAPRLVGPEALRGGVSMQELQFLASTADNPLSRRELLKLALIGTGVVTGLTLTPRFARADDADGGGSSDSMSSADTESGISAIPTTKLLPIFVNFRGGANTRYLFRHHGLSAPESSNGPLVAPPQTQLGVPADYLMVPTADGTSTEHFLHRRPDILAMDTDHKTNSHQEGYNAANTGDPDGVIPSMAVLNAYRYRPNSPFSYAVGPNVGLPFTGGLAVGANSLDTQSLKKLAHPNVAGQNEIIFPNQVVDYLTSLRAYQIQQVMTGNYLPRLKRFAAGRAQTQSAAEEVQKLLDLIGTLKQAQNNPFLAATMIAVALFKEGYVASLSLARSGFDTHREVAGAQSMSLFDQSFKAFDQMFSYAEGQKSPVFDDIMLVVTTDFGRNGIGNDSAAHWPIGTSLVMGGPLKGQGPRLVGITNDHQDLIGEEANIGDAIQHVRNIIGVGDNNFPVKTTIPGLTSPKRIQEILDNQ